MAGVAVATIIGVGTSQRYAELLRRSSHAVPPRSRARWTLDARDPRYRRSASSSAPQLHQRRSAIGGRLEASAFDEALVRADTGGHHLHGSVLMNRCVFSFAVASLGVGVACGPNWDAIEPALGAGAAPGAHSGSSSATGAGGCSGGADCSGSSSVTGAGGGCSSDVDCKNAGECFASCVASACVPAPAGAACKAGRCDGQGACIQCASPADCSGRDSFCGQRTCLMSTCGWNYAPAGIALPDTQQAVGDCKILECDGAGNVQQVAANSDLPVDGVDCTTDVCTAGVPSNLPKVAEMPCVQGGGSVCDGRGSCVDCVTKNDCAIGKCLNGACSLDPHCIDGLKSGDESDVDCGGQDCTRCADNQSCVLGSDCHSLVCSNGSCITPTCSDLVKNGAETDVDCGGSCATHCGLGASCAVDMDCGTQSCGDGVCVCAAGMADCNGNPSDGCEVSTATDPLHCGGCDTTCGAGSDVRLRVRSLRGRDDFLRRRLLRQCQGVGAGNRVGNRTGPVELRARGGQSGSLDRSLGQRQLRPRWRGDRRQLRIGQTRRL